MNKPWTLLRFGYWRSQKNLKQTPVIYITAPGLSSSILNLKRTWSWFWLHRAWKESKFHLFLYSKQHDELYEGLKLSHLLFFSSLWSLTWSGFHIVFNDYRLPHFISWGRSSKTGNISRIIYYQIICTCWHWMSSLVRDGFHWPGNLSPVANGSSCWETGRETLVLKTWPILFANPFPHPVPTLYHRRRSPGWRTADIFIVIPQPHKVRCL